MRKDLTLELLHRECEGIPGAGPRGVVRHIQQFELDVNETKHYVLQRASWFAREWYDRGAINSNRKWYVDALSTHHLHARTHTRRRTRTRTHTRTYVRTHTEAKVRFRTP